MVLGSWFATSEIRVAVSATSTPPNMSLLRKTSITAAVKNASSRGSDPTCWCVWVCANRNKNNIEVWGNSVFGSAQKKEKEVWGKKIKRKRGRGIHKMSMLTIFHA